MTKLFPQMISFPRIQELHDPEILTDDILLLMLLIHGCSHFDSERAKDITAENMKWFQIYFVTLTNIKSSMKQLGISDC